MHADGRLAEARGELGGGIAHEDASVGAPQAGGFPWARESPNLVADAQLVEDLQWCRPQPEPGADLS